MPGNSLLDNSLSIVFTSIKNWCIFSSSKLIFLVCAKTGEISKRHIKNISILFILLTLRLTDLPYHTFIFYFFFLIAFTSLLLVSNQQLASLPKILLHLVIQVYGLSQLLTQKHLLGKSLSAI